ncbi:MAG: sulfate transporter subunit [Planctomyces sp.]|nr:sulfate transporter subunit [Planctomyces sp.]
MPFRTTLSLSLVLLAGLAVSAGWGCNTKPAGSVELLHVSYDVTRELCHEVNNRFIKQYETKTGKPLAIKQSHGGSSSQARSVIDGLKADVVSLALWLDVNAISKSGLIEPGWEQRLPNESIPYHSTVVFVVRKGNPKQIKDWPDLVKEGVEVITPNPKTSGNGKLSFLAAWGSVTTRGGSEDEAKVYLSALYQHVPVLESGGRGATTTFLNKQIGDVQLAWENEGYLAVKESEGEVEIVYPPVSIRAEPVVAVVTAVAKRKGTTAVADDYLKFYFEPEIQKLIAESYFRPSDAAVLEEFKDKFPPVQLFRVTDITTSWDEAQSKFFSEGAIFDTLSRQAAK